MTKKQYSVCRITIVATLGVLISLSINLNNYYLPLVFIISAMALMYFCKKQLKTKEPLSDERDYKIAGDAARYSIFIFAVMGTIGTFVLMALSEKEGVLYLVSQLLAFSVCFLMLSNAFIFRYLSKKG